MFNKIFSKKIKNLAGVDHVVLDLAVVAYVEQDLAGLDHVVNDLAVVAHVAQEQDLDKKN